MAFATNTLVNGEWTTRTVDVDAVLRHYDQQDKEAATNAVEVERPPVLGLLTQTVIRSPLVHWILPVKLRGMTTNDVAFIGDEFVQIKELRFDGHLWDVIQKENFGARIRNARVVGSAKTDPLNYEDDISSSQVKDEDEDVEMNVGELAQHKRNSRLSPQALLLQLDSGDSVFLILRENGSGNWEFVSSRHRLSKAMLNVQGGMHLAVDPSSRYVAIGCSEGLFAIYCLNSREELRRQLSEGEALRYVESERYIYFRGVVHKMEFLYPSPGDDDHIVLMVLLIWRGKTRMLLYEWETGKDLRDIRARSRRGHLLEQSRQMPLLVIPLTIKSSFILISEDSMTLCKDLLQGNPQFIDFNNSVEKPTEYYHGLGLPLWTAWTRPDRLPHHTKNRDDIYVVREDGLVKFLEIDSLEDDIVRAYNTIGSFDSNCGTSLASLDYRGYDSTTGDLLVTGGNSCGGGTYLVRARKAPIFMESIQNWSPAQDLVITSSNQDRETIESDVPPRNRDSLPKPDRIFACVGKGSKGAITEFRYGLEARLGLETELDIPVLDVRVLPPSLCSIEDGSASLFLLSLVDRSALLHLSSDAMEIKELDQDSTLLDLRHRTIVTDLHGGNTIQVTEKSVMFRHEQNSYIYEGEELLGIYNDGICFGCGASVDHAVAYQGIVIFTTHFLNETYLQILDPLSFGAFESQELPSSSNNTIIRTLCKFSSHVTCLGICMIQQTLCAVIALWEEEITKIIFQPVRSGDQHTLSIPTSCGSNRIRPEAIISLTVLCGAPGTLVFTCGTRNGIVVMIRLDEQTLEFGSSCCQRIGSTPVNIKRDESMGSEELLFLNCDSRLYALKIPALQRIEFTRDMPMKRYIYQIWLTDAMNPSLQQPGVNAVGKLDGARGDLLIVSGSQLLLARLSTQPKAVPRHIPIGGTPTRLMYSPTLGVLVVAASVKGRCTLKFIDPDTGTDLSRPVDKEGDSMEFVSGLGELNERVFRLLEWSYIKDGKTWHFIVVCTNTGRLLIISTRRETLPEAEEWKNHYKARSMADSRVDDQATIPELPGIRHWTRYKFKCEKPVYSVAGFSEGLFYCSGSTLYCDTLNLADKRFRTIAKYDFPSPAIDLVHENGTLYALTIAHSLEILQLVQKPGESSKIIRTHGDQVTRNALHHRILGNASELLVDLVSDKACSVVGLWATRNTRADTLEAVFEAELRYSILRFRSGNCRPIWDPNWYSSTRYGASDPETASNLAKYPEVFGLAIDGSLCHFTVLDGAAWKFLRFIINLAKQSPKICEFTYSQGTFPREPTTEPKTMMQVDGDILRRCVEEKGLEELFCIGQETGEAIKTQGIFYDLLQGLHRGRLGKDAAMSVCVQRAYKDLEFFLRPVL